METVVIDSRFRGPPQSANGGYASGVLARRLEGAVEVTLRAPLPLDEELQVVSDGSDLVLRHGDTVLAEARRAELDLKVPDPVSLAEAAAAAAAAEGSRVFQDHPFPGCFGCGPERGSDDGLRLFPGPIQERAIAACAWTPQESFADRLGQVPPEIVWVALDCPTSWGGDLYGEARPSMLGRLTGEIMSPIEAGTPMIVIAWPIGAEGRKWEGGSALFTEAGELKALSRGLWIELRE
jgi:hypothetical protein